MLFMSISFALGGQRKHSFQWNMGFRISVNRRKQVLGWEWAIDLNWQHQLVALSGALTSVPALKIVWVYYGNPMQPILHVFHVGFSLLIRYICLGYN